jgi:hypothetical protein
MININAVFDARHPQKELENRNHQESSVHHFKFAYILTRYFHTSSFDRNKLLAYGGFLQSSSARSI